MKKILLMLAVAGLAVSSCKKDYKCQCIATDNGTVIHKSEIEIFHDTKSNAKVACSSGNETNGSISNVCTIQ